MTDKSQDILIGIDAGTSLIKCVAFSVRGDVLAFSSTPNEYTTSNDEMAEQDMLETRQKMINTLKELVTKLGDKSYLISAVSVTAQGDGMWLVDAAGDPVHKGWLWLDSRAAEIATELEQNPLYDRLYELTGTAVNAAQARTQMMWLDRHKPELLDKATTCYHPKDYLYFVLTGQRATDPGEGLFNFGDIRKGVYSDEVLSILGLSHRANLLPPMIDGLDDSSNVLEAIAKLIGLPAGTPVHIGAIDVMCSALGGGMYERGLDTAMTILGTTGVHLRYTSQTDAISLPEEKTGYSIVFPGGGIAQLQTNMSATLNIDWLVQVAKEMAELSCTSVTTEQLLAQFDEKIDTDTPSRIVYHPYISTAGERGPFFDVNARASFSGLDQNVGFIDLAKAVYEGICFAAKDCYMQFGELPVEIRITGGGANSVALKKLLANIMNRPVRSVSRAEAGAAGAAMIAAVGQGYYSSMSDCVADWVAPSLGEINEPIADSVKHFERNYHTYSELKNNLRPGWTNLADMRSSNHKPV